MKIDIYSSVDSKMKYLSVPTGTDVAALQFPVKLDADLRTVRFKSQLELIPGEHYVAVDAHYVVGQIKVKGYALHSATITITTEALAKV
jgi:hypothetical protein